MRTLLLTATLATAFLTAPVWAQAVPDTSTAFDPSVGVPATGTAGTIAPASGGLTPVSRMAGRLYVENVEVTTVAPGYRPPGATYTPAPIVSRRYTWQAYQGDDPISEVEFYRLAGRQDLVDRTQRRRQNRTLLAIGGAALVAAGVGIGVTALGAREVTEPPLFPGDDPEVTQEDDPVRLAIGGSLIGAGALGLTLGITLGTRRSTHAQAAAEMAAAYNERLSAAP